MRHAFINSMVLAGAFVAGTAAIAGAQGYPTRPIHFIATEVPGSATDIQARIIAKGMSQVLGQPIEIENLFGEAGLEKGIKSAPDGYTIVYGGSGTLGLLPHIKKVSFNPLKDLTPVGRFVESPTLMAVNPSLSIHSVRDLVVLMKNNPGKFRMSTAGAGTAGHFAGEMFLSMAGVKAEIVHYAGGGPAIEAVVRNDSQWTMAPIAGRLPRVRTGALRAIATGGPTRLSMLPDVPTVAESGYPGFNATGWSAIYVPNGVPQAIVDKLNDAIVKAVAMSQVKKEFEDQGVEGVSSTQAEVRKMLDVDYVRLGEVAKKIGVSVD